MANLKLIGFKALNLSKNKYSSIIDIKSKKNIDFIKEINTQENNNEQKNGDIIQIEDSHQATIAILKAETSMKIMLEVRNKAMNAYKEILRMQV